MFGKLFNRKKGLNAYAQQVDEHRHVVKKAAPIKIGWPANAPSDDLLGHISQQLQLAGVTEAYFFWMCVGDENPHMGLAIAPNNDELLQSVGQCIEPIWSKHSPENPVFDILRLGSELDRTIQAEGRRLV